MEYCTFLQHFLTEEVSIDTLNREAMEAMEAPRQPPKQTVGTAQQGLKIRLFTLPKEATETGFFLSQKLYLCCTVALFFNIF